MNAQEKIDNLKKTLETAGDDIKRLETLKAMFHDLRIDINRWKTERFCSKSVTTIATKYEVGYSCSCCVDAALQLYLYVDTDHGRVYSDPPCFFIGEKGYRGRDIPGSDWEGELERAGVQQSVIASVERRFVDDDEQLDDDE